MSNSKPYISIQLEPDSDEWHEWRAGGVTATDAVVLMGRHPQKTVWRLWAEKTQFAAVPDISGNPNVRRGKRLEPHIREEWEQKNGEILLPLYVENRKLPLLRASLDGIDSRDRPVEIKAPGDKVWAQLEAEGRESQAFKQYWVQVQHQLLATLAPEGVLVFYHETHGMLEFVIKRDNAFCRELLSAIKVFWQQVQSGIPPEKDLARDVFIPEGSVAQEWKVQATRFREAELEIKELKARIKTLEARQEEPLQAMVELMGGHLRADYHGVQVTLYESQGPIDYQKVVVDHLDITSDELEEYRRPNSWRQRVSVSERLTPKLILDEDVLEDAQQEVDSGIVEDGWF